MEALKDPFLHVAMRLLQERLHDGITNRYISRGLAILVSIVHESWHWSCSGSPLGRGEVVASSIQGPILGVGVARLDVL